MRNIICICICCVAGWLAACSDGEKLESGIDFSSPYVIKDNPDDPVQHRCYQIYQAYNVPVFFKDTIQETCVGKTLSGEDIIRYETLDLNWSYSSHSKNDIDYSYDYLESEEDKNKALDFVELYLSSIYKPMRPFSILLVDKMYKYDRNKEVTTEIDDFFVGFRTLVVPDLLTLTEEEMAVRSDDILRNMVTSKVKANTELVERFGEVSSKENYYDKMWGQELGCEPLEYFKFPTVFPPSKLYDEGFLEGKYVQPGEDGSLWIWIDDYYLLPSGGLEEVRRIIIEQIGRFGFICGNIKDNREGTNSPKDSASDLEQYIKVLLEIGSEEFVNRYGSSPLVLIKFNLINDFLKYELGVDLKK